MTAVIISPGQGFLQPKVQDDEQTSAAHLLDLEFGDSGFAVCLTDGDRGEAVTANNGLQGHLP